MIRLEGVVARRRATRLSRVSVAWGDGVHGVLGRPEDGTSLLLDVLCGRVRVRAGTMHVLDGSAHHPSVRAQIASIPLDAELPDALRVDETLAVAAALRGEPPRAPDERLGALGVEALARRAVRSLSLAEVRAVALAEAVTSARVRLLLVDEPLVGMDPRAARFIPERLRALASAGACVVVTTASSDEAHELADDCAVLRAGVLRTLPSDRSPSALSLSGAPLRITARDTRDAKALAAALAGAESVAAVAQEGSQVVAHGADAVALARTVAGAVADARLDVAEVRFDDGARPASATGAST